MTYTLLNSVRIKLYSLSAVLTVLFGLRYYPFGGVSLGVMLAFFLIFVGLPLSRRVRVDGSGIECRNWLFGWRLKWPDIDYWEIQAYPRQADKRPPTLFLIDKSGQTRALPPTCIDRTRLLAIEQVLQQRLPHAPIPWLSTLRSSPEWYRPQAKPSEA
ncbi:hypothetical protein ACH518_06805 [Methylomonas sp. HW2-6]|uniref:hypothetical protein n=1 Tax=Methylomonas sp. HW2-6 TaxID=3376687 RepID=UPI004041E9C6